MKKRLFSIRHEQGFILPFVLVITAIVLLVLATAVHTYQNDLRITHNHIQYLKMASLAEMGRTKFTNEVMPLHQKDGTTEFNFSQGTAHIDYYQETDTYYVLVTIKMGDKEYRANYAIKIPSSIQIEN